MKRTLALAALVASLAAPALAQTAAPAPSATGAASYMTQEKAGQWRASKLQGLNVYNASNEKIGDINELIVGTDGKIDAAVIGVGGFLGMGEHNVAVPFKDLRFSMDASKSGAKTDASTTGSTNGTVAAYPDHAVLNLTKDQLKSAPAFTYAK